MKKGTGALVPILVVVALVATLIAGATRNGLITIPSDTTCSTLTELHQNDLPDSVPKVLAVIFTPAAERWGVPSYSLALVYARENGSINREPPPPYGHGPPWPVSSAGAYGGMQFLKGSYFPLRNSNPAHSPGNVLDLIDASYAAAHYLSILGVKKDSPFGDPLNPKKGTVVWALGAYNAGPHSRVLRRKHQSYRDLSYKEYLSSYAGKTGTNIDTTVPAGDDCGTASTPTSGDVTALIATARQYVWVNGQANAGGPAQKGAYHEAVQLAIRKGWHVGGSAKAGNDCAGFINILMRTSGYEPNWPNATTAGLASAIARLPGWQKVGTQRGRSFSIGSLRPGDVLVTPYKGHVLLFIGKVSWTSSQFVEAANGSNRAPYTMGTQPGFWPWGYVVLRKVGATSA